MLADLAFGFFSFFSFCFHFFLLLFFSFALQQSLAARLAFFFSLSPIVSVFGTHSLLVFRPLLVSLFSSQRRADLIAYSTSQSDGRVGPRTQNAPLCFCLLYLLPERSSGNQYRVTEIAHAEPALARET